MAMLSGWAIQIKINDALTTSGDGERWATHRDPEKEKRESESERGRQTARQDSDKRVT